MSTQVPASRAAGGNKPRRKSADQESSETFDANTWSNVCNTKHGDLRIRKRPKDKMPKPEARKGWKTIRIFVSSTFRDFHHEREVLVKKVFPDLRLWCQERRLHLIECDLRWGVPKDSPDEKTLRACLEEIDRCIEDNKMPYFINMTSERVGWIPAEGQIPSSLKDKYRWIFGMSVTEMEIIHGAYRKENPNALFLLRDQSFIAKIPDEKVKKDFKDAEEKLAPGKLKVLKEKIEERFPENRVIRYKCRYKGQDPISRKAILKLKGHVEEKILQFFKERIEHQYPHSIRDISDPLERQTENHEAFMKGRVDFLSEKDEVVRQIVEYLTSEKSTKPLVLVGTPWAGVSAITSGVKAILQEKAAEAKQSGKKSLWHVRNNIARKEQSSDMYSMTESRLSESESGLLGDVEALKWVYDAPVSGDDEKHEFFIIDAIHQVFGEDEKGCDEMKAWLPEKLPFNVRVLLSVEQGSKQHHFISGMEGKGKPEIMQAPEPSCTVKQILKCITENDSDKPLILVGSPGSGKSTITAIVTDTLCELAQNNKINGGGEKGWMVFYHFVGAVPGSTDLMPMLKRLLQVLQMEEANSGDLTTLKQSCYSALSNPNTRPLFVIIDAVNQMDEELGGELLTWLPSKLSPSVRVLVSMIDGCGHHDSITARESPPHVITVSALTLTERKEIIQRFLKKHNKEVSVDQMVALLEKSDNPSSNNPLHSEQNKDIVQKLIGKYSQELTVQQIIQEIDRNASLQPGSNNPLWLNVACDELRVYGLFREMDKKIKELPEDLLGLLGYVLQRFELELEEDCDLMKATLCLLETSKAGLCEVEIKEILGDQTHLLPGDNPEAESAAPLFTRFDPPKRVADLNWHSVYRVLRPFLRPYGESGEGRLDFYHRTLSKVVRKRYLKADGKQLRGWWQKKLADYFESSSLPDRRVEEYPHHLIATGDRKRLKSFLLEWHTFDKLYDQDLSMTLLRYWREVNSDSPYTEMAEAYSKIFPDAEVDDTEKCSRTVKVATVMLQAHKLDDALELGKTALQIAEKIGSMLETMVEINMLFAEVYNLKSKEFARVCDDMVPFIEQCLNYNDKAIEMLRKGKDKNAKKNLGRQLLSRATARASLVDVLGVTRGDAESGLRDVEEAMVIFNEMKDESHIAEALMQKAGLMNLDLPGAYKIYQEALERCLNTNGKFHILSSRLYKNTGICAEDLGDESRKRGNIQEAEKYRKESYLYYKGYYEVNMEIFGRNHARTKVAMEYVQECADIANAMGHSYDFIEKCSQ